MVEMKRSDGTVVSGYEKQLEKYKKAARTNYAVFVVIDYGGATGKIRTIRSMQAKQIEKGHRASEIVVIDATKKLSPSKLR